MHQSFLLIPIVLVLLVGGASENNPSSVQPIAEKEKDLPKEQKASATQEKDHSQNVSTANLDKPSTPSTNQKTEDNRDSAKQPVPSITDWTIAGVTTAYAFFALLQWLAIRRQASIAAAGIKVARHAAKAAEESAKAVDAQLHVYRPFIVVRKPFTNSVKADLPLRRRIPTTVHIKVRNYGIGPADITDYFIKAEIFDWAGTDPPLPTYRRDEAYQTLDPIIEAEGERQLIDLPFDTSESDFTAMLNDTKRLAFHGIINYRGGPEKIYWTRFFWWCLSENKIVRANTPELNAHT